MSHAYDTGLALPYRTLVRHQVLALLAPLLKANGGFLPAVLPLPGTLRSYEGGDGVNQLYTTLLGRSPAIAVVCGDRRQERASVSGFRNLSELEVHLYFVNNSMRSLMARVEADVVSTGDPNAQPPIAASDTADPGLEVTMELAEELLTGQSIDTVKGVIKQLELVREEGLYTGNQHTIWQQTYQVTVTRSINRNRNIQQRITGFSTIVRPSGEAIDSPAAITFTTEVP